MAICIGTAAFGSAAGVIFDGDLVNFLPGLNFGADFPDDEVDKDFDALRDGALMETRFVAALSSAAGEARAFFPPGGAIRTEGRFVPPLILSANSFLRTTEQCWS